MPRWTARPLPDRTVELANRTKVCPTCSRPLWAAAKPYRSVTTLDGIVRLHLKLRSCRNPNCPRRNVCLRPDQEGRFALPHHEFGLDVIALVGRLRHAELIRGGQPGSCRSTTPQTASQGAGPSSISQPFRAQSPMGMPAARAALSPA
jgi:hypothetical protein